MKAYRKIIYILLFMCIIVLISIYFVNQKKTREWEKQQSEIDISAEEVIQYFIQFGFPLDDIVDTTKEVSKARFGEPISAFDFTLSLDKTYRIGVLEYENWEEANNIVEFRKKWLKDTFQEYKGGLFSHGSVAIFINPPNEDLEIQLKDILVEIH